VAAPESNLAKTRMNISAVPNAGKHDEKRKNNDEIEKVRLPRALTRTGPNGTPTTLCGDFVYGKSLGSLGDPFQYRPQRSGRRLGAN